MTKKVVTVRKQEPRKQKASGLNSVQTYKARTLLEMLREAANGEQPADLIMGSDIPIYTTGKEGTRPEHNIRTDRFDIALETVQWAEEKRTALKAEAEKTEAGTAGEGQ